MTDVDEYARSFDLDDSDATAEQIDGGLAAIRSRCPVLHARAMSGTEPTFLVTDHEHIRQVGADSELYAARTAGGGTARDLDHSYDIISAIFDTDGTVHRDLRRDFGRLLNPRAARAWEATAREIARDHLAKLAPRGSCDAIADITYRLPWPITAGLLGVDAAHHDAYRELALGCFLRGEEEPFEQLLHGEVARKRTHPGEDLISIVLASPVDGDRLPTDAEVVRFAKIMSGAGSLTSADLTGSLLLELADNRPLRQRILAEPALVPRLVDELARTQSAVFSSARRATRDTVLDGQHIPAGSMMRMCWGSAARDARVHDAPDEVRLDRRLGAHMGWGSGPHHCAGKEIALVTIPAFLTEILRALGDYRLAPGAAPRRTFGVLRGVASLPIEWDPA